MLQYPLSFPEKRKIELSRNSVSRKLFKAGIPELEDSDVCKALDLLKAQFPDIEGLQYPAQGKVSYSRAKTELDTAHIIYDSERSHWVTVIIPKTMKDSATVFVFDSLCRNGADNVTNSLRCKIASICFEPGPAINVVYPPCHQQSDSDKDMCYFAVANALEFCISRRIKCTFYKVEVMPSHLQNCLREKKLTTFQKDTNKFRSPQRNCKRERIDIYCFCRMPMDSQTVQCIECFESFHLNCVGLPSAPESWICQKHDE